MSGLVVKTSDIDYDSNIVKNTRKGKPA
jgi:hypothetical protein